MDHPSALWRTPTSEDVGRDGRDAEAATGTGDAWDGMAPDHRASLVAVNGFVAKNTSYLRFFSDQARTSSQTQKKGDVRLREMLKSSDVFMRKESCIYYKTYKFHERNFSC